MKNWGKFFILILIITVFTACGQKGEGGGGTTGPTSPYTWEELEFMAKDSIHSIQVNSNIELIAFDESLKNNYQKTEIQNLINKLNSIIIGIYQRNLDVNKEIEYIKNEVQRLSQNVFYSKNYSELIIFRDSIKNAKVDPNPNSPYNKLSNEEKERIDDLNGYLESALSNINLGKGENAFYAEIHHLHYESQRLYSESLLLAKIGIDYDNIDISNSILNRIRIANSEKNRLKSIEQKVTNTFFTQLNKYYAELLDAYNNYTPGRESDIAFAEENFRLFEGSLFTTNTEADKHRQKIKELDNVKDQLGTDTIANVIISLLNDFTTKEQFYNNTNGNFEKIASMALNIEYTFYQLKVYENQIKERTGIVLN